MKARVKKQAQIVIPNNIMPERLLDAAQNVQQQVQDAQTSGNGMADLDIELLKSMIKQAVREVLMEQKSLSAPIAYWPQPKQTTTFWEE